MTIHYADPQSLDGWDPSRDLGLPGSFPYTRGIQPTMYRGRLWTMRQYAGFGTAAESNAAIPVPAGAGRQRPQRRLRPADADGLRLGPSAGGRRSRPCRRGDRLDRGHGGALRRHSARSRLDVDDDQRHGDHPAGALRRGRAPARASRLRPCRARSRTTSSRSTSRAAPTSTRRARRSGSSPTSSPTASASCRSGTRSRSAGITSARPARRRSRKSRSRSPTRSPTCRRRSTAGLDVDRFGQRLSFFFNAHNDFLEEIAKFRAARRLWARIMRERFGATNPRAEQLRFHTQTAGSTLTAQQPDNNIVRVAVQALAAVLGGTQSLHCNGRDEALALPTEEAARIALRTQQIIAAETGVANTVDPLAGSYAIEALTNEIESRRARVARSNRGRRRNARGDRAGPHPARDPGVRLSRPAADRRRGARGGRRQRASRPRAAPASRS